jgi:hypothetical protein
MVWFFQPLMLPMLGFAAGAMMYLVIVGLIPHALENAQPDANRRGVSARLWFDGRWCRRPFRHPIDAVTIGDWVVMADCRWSRPNCLKSKWSRVNHPCSADTKSTSGAAVVVVAL